MNVYPVYFLQVGEGFEVVFPEDKADLGHTEFWERVVSHRVAHTHRIPQAKLANLPYCQRRARIVDDRCYYGENPDSDLLELVRKAVGNHDLVFVHDDHEKRLKDDVLQFRKLIRRYRPKSTMT